MGLFDLLKGQLIDVIEWTDSSTNTMVYRYDRDGTGSGTLTPTMPTWMGSVKWRAASPLVLRKPVAR